MSAPVLLAPETVYPESDGKPMSDNMTQGRWITLLYENLEALFANDPNVLVAADNLIYPIEGNNKVRQAPDVYVVFGRPKGDRGSYLYWKEENVPVTVAFEILSPGNHPFEMADKLEFYNDHGIEEYYVYDPDSNRLMIYLRRQVLLVRHHQADGFVSPRMGIRFDLSGEELVIRHPDGRPFVRLFEQLRITEAESRRAEAEKQRAEAEKQRAEAEKQRAEFEQQQRRITEQRLTRMIELNRKSRSGQATVEELAELERLEGAG